jgi:hypothetical protein
MIFDKKQQRIFEKEMKIPCHIDYITTRVFKAKPEETQEIINQLLDEGIVEESPYAKKYYKIK